MSCLICKRIEQIKRKENRYFVKELKTGYVVLGDHQYFKGYTLFLCKQHALELFNLDQDFGRLFMEEMNHKCYQLDDESLQIEIKKLQKVLNDLL